MYWPSNGEKSLHWNYSMEEIGIEKSELKQSYGVFYYTTHSRNKKNYNIKVYENKCNSLLIEIQIMALK